jgi:alpha-N-acetylglucosamine transferase
MVKNIDKIKCFQSFIHNQIWGLEFEKIVYLDSDCLVLDNIDELFNYPELSAAVDCCDHFNAGIFVAKPSPQKFQDILTKLKNKLPSYDKADQGFLNSYFKNQFHPLKFKYNADQYILSKNMKISEEPIKVIHYEHEHKPWKYNEITVPSELKPIHQQWWEIQKIL